MWLLSALLVAEAALLACSFAGGWLRELDGKRWAIFSSLAVLAGLQSHVHRHRDAYRSVRISWPLVAAQIACFACVYAYTGWLARGGAHTRFGAGELLAGAVCFVAWGCLSLAVIVPRLDLARQVLGTVLALGLFAFAAWQVGELTLRFWQVTGDSTVRLVELLLQPFAGGPVVRPDTFVIGTADFQVSISEPCCGFHGIGLITTLLAGYLWWFRRMLRFPQALLLLPIGVTLMWLANAVRIAALVLVGIWISPAIAVDGFHSVAGWLAFLAVGLGIIWAATRMPFFTRMGAIGPGSLALAPMAAAPPASTTVSPATAEPGAIACLVPFLALTASTMLTQAFTSGFDLLYPVRVVVVATVLWRLRHSIPWRTFAISPAAVAIGAVAFAAWMLLAPGPDAALAAARDPAALGQPWATLWLLCRIAGATITVPIAEELFFRGFVLRRCIGEDVDAVPIGAFSWFSFLLSSVAFGLLHGDAWVAGTVAGMLFALAVYTRKNLGDAVVAHATTNALLTGYVLATRSWSQWG
jgi:exosortase E/protease (VPEID-CTERM system)